MYDFIKGELIAIKSNGAIVSTCGLGYKIFIPVDVLSKLPALGSTVCLFTSFVVRELSHTLYGFLTDKERDFFELLMEVSGIGPKLALSIIGHMPLAKLQKAIFNREILVLCKVPGIGKKTAERLSMELRDKLGDVAQCSEAVPISARNPKADQIKDAMSALINLGYNQMTAQKAVKKTVEDLDESAELAEMIMHALKHV